jgi:large subunit ribosomal protein L10
MKSKAQKQEELDGARKLLEKSEALVFTDFTKIAAESIRKFRRDLKAADSDFLVIKKRLLSILLKEKGIDVDLKQFKTSVGTIFSRGDIEKIAGPAFTFFSKLEVPEGGAKDVWIKHLLGGYNLAKKEPLNGVQVVYIGKLPPREAILSQLLGILSAPIRSFLYVLDQKSKQTN